MTLPLNSISVLIQIRVFPNYEFKEQWEENAVKDLLKRGFIENVKSVKSSVSEIFKVTEKGKCFVDYIAEIPEPVNTWAIKYARTD